jgi:hypothetical protein
MKTKTVYSITTGQKEIAHESPREPGVFLIPANTTEKAPPDYDAETQVLRYDGKWIVEDVPQPEPEPEPEPPTPEQQIEMLQSQRRSAYQQESDPIYFLWQRGKATEQDWLDAVAAIKARFPKP